MKIQVKLFANFRDYLPPGSDKFTCWVELEEGATIGRVLEKLKIPECIPMITLVDGIHRATEEPLHPGEVLSVFPPVAGG
jgi:molybdopterin converting factor small subunit